MEKIQIETAQNVIIEHYIAGLGQRILAFLADIVILICYVLVLRWGLSELDIHNNYVVFVFLQPFFFYHFLFEAFFEGQSPGKMLLKIRVVRLDGYEVSMGDYFLRWVLRTVDISMMMGSVAVIAIISNGKGQRIGDIAAGTTVVSIKDRSQIGDAIFAEVPEGYKVQTPEVLLLTDQDINTVKEVMKYVDTYRNERAVQLAYKTKTALEEKMEIKSDLNARQFFIQVLQDYTVYHSENSGSWL